jgi:hypothetical protein
MTSPPTRHAALAAMASVLTIIVLATGCGASGPTGPQPAGPITIECQVFYRASAGEGFQESIINLGPGNGTHSEGFDELTFSAQYMDDPGEGPSLALAVSDAGVEREISRQLYQIDRSRGLANQFIGGHGFTGLNYVFRPSSSAELQYFCLAK